jgi:hypothetical protein
VPGRPIVIKPAPIKTCLVGLLAAAAVAVAGCGSQEASVLKTAFDHPIKSANVTLTMDMSPVHVALAGPYKANGANKLPSLDWTIHVAGGPKAIDGELISTGDDAFIKYDGQTYEAGRAAVAKLQAQAAQQGSLRSVDIAQLTRQMRSWFPDTSAQSDARLDGEAVTRVTGRLDLSKAVKDIAQMAKSGPAITQKDLNRLDTQVTDPRFTVDVAKSDGKLRRILATLRIRGQGALRFQIRYRDVDQPVTIDAPSSGLPLSRLQQKLEHDFGSGDRSVGGGSATATA